MDFGDFFNELKKYGKAGKIAGNVLGGVWDYLCEEQVKYDNAEEKLSRRGLYEWDDSQLLSEESSCKDTYEKKVLRVQIRKRIQALHSDSVEDDSSLE